MLHKKKEQKSRKLKRIGNDAGGNGKLSNRELTKKTPSVIAGLAVLTACVLAVESALAGPFNPAMNVASENFEYSDDVGEPLDGLNGGSGWDGAWSAEADGDPGWQIEEPDFGSWPGIFGTEDLPLAFEDGVVARTERQGSATRDFANVPQATAGSSYWLSVLNLARFDDEEENTLSLNLRDSDGNTLVGFDIDDSDQTDLDVAIRGGGDTATGSYTPTERGRWIIGQIDYAGGGNGDVHLWVFDGDDLAGISDIESWNPDIGDATLSASVEDGSLDLDFTEFEMLQEPNNNAIRMDRINLTHIPEPSTLALLGLAGLLLMKRRRL